ncbi:MAG TPA: RHS repeat-associated core domain-containing protein [Chitinophagaceae bacterium]|nr:RHS repeat-associated core domain-containing protein [Chitinophagaceae bacterium]
MRGSKILILVLVGLAFGRRYYDPEIGMWTSVDPAGQFHSPYSYAGNGMNPISAKDPDGNELIITFTNAKGEQVPATDALNNLVNSEAFMDMVAPMIADKVNVFDVKIVVDKQYFNSKVVNGKTVVEVGQCKDPVVENPSGKEGAAINRYNIFVAGLRKSVEVGVTVFHELFHGEQRAYYNVTDYEVHHNNPQLKAGEQDVKKAYK